MKKGTKHLKNHNPDSILLSDGKIEFQTMSTPYCCPVCNGQGLVPNGFYLAIGVASYSTTSATFEQCRSCNGTGIVWS